MESGLEQGGRLSRNNPQIFDYRHIEIPVVHILPKLAETNPAHIIRKAIVEIFFLVPHVRGDLQRHAEQIIPSYHRGMLPEFPVNRRLSATHIGVVNHVVMHKGCKMQQLNRYRKPYRVGVDIPRLSSAGKQRGQRMNCPSISTNVGLRANHLGRAEQGFFKLSPDRFKAFKVHGHFACIHLNHCINMTSSQAAGSSTAFSGRDRRNNQVRISCPRQSTGQRRRISSRRWCRDTGLSCMRT